MQWLSSINECFIFNKRKKNKIHVKVIISYETYEMKYLNNFIFINYIFIKNVNISAFHLIIEILRCIIVI